MRSSKSNQRPLPERILSIYQQGFVKGGACRPRCEVAVPDFNVAQTLEWLIGANAGHDLAKFSEKSQPVADDATVQCRFRGSCDGLKGSTDADLQLIAA